MENNGKITHKLWIEGPFEDSEFGFKSLSRALDSFSRHSKDSRNRLALFEITEKGQECIKSNDQDVFKIGHILPA